jgi:predicted transcriptional regulator
MRRDVLTVKPDVPVDVLVDECLMQGDQRGFPVVDDGDVLGLVCLQDIRKIPRREWHATAARDIMTPAGRLSTIGPDADVALAMQYLSQGGVNQLPVVAHGELKGLIRREDILTWLSLYGKDAG